ncbi:hypothetical protein EWB00_000201 [Schistosoma japonicum]|uniref:Uncharacterized protein n=1 Tax=Schistosoma japonicum TaxID=6182 RepID=A0A4Z2CKH0_SCHJA|nr:hypothetical protein EWB00_000201 [Schistosoma japonicum]
MKQHSFGSDPHVADSRSVGRMVVPPGFLRHTIDVLEPRDLVLRALYVVSCGRDLMDHRSGLR